MTATARYGSMPHYATECVASFNFIDVLTVLYVNLKQLDKLPLELLELVLMRTFMKLFNDDYKSHYKTHEAIPPAYSTLAAVCYNWWQTMNGWPDSDTRLWLKHKLLRCLGCKPLLLLLIQ